MGFSLFCIIESAILVANAIAILNDRFLIKFGLTMDKLESSNGSNESFNNQGAPPSGIDDQNRDEKVTLASSRG